jgi:hypothetical protein
MNDGGCTCRTWSLSDVDIEHETGLISEEIRAREMYYKVVANWNEYVRRTTSEEVVSYPDFCRYLLDIYTQLSARESKGVSHARGGDQSV